MRHSFDIKQTSRAEKVEGREKVFRLIVQLISGMTSRKITVAILRNGPPPAKTLCSEISESEIVFN